MTAPVPEDKLRLGGMALRNGLLVHGPTHWAAAVRTDAGEIKVASGRKPDLGGKAAERVPGVRGVVKLAEAMAVIPLVKRALPGGAAADAGREDARRDGRRRAGRPGDPHRGRAQARPRRAGREAAVALVSIAPALLALRSGDLAAYHGVEHKSIAGYEDGRRRRRRRQGARPLRLPPGRADAHRGRARATWRCAAPGCAGPRPRPPSGSAAPPWRSRCSPGASAIPTRRFTRLLRRPGHEIQRAVGTREPTRRAARGRHGGARRDPAGGGRGAA